MSDLFQQQAAAANAELLLLNAQRAYQLAEVSLMQTLQLDPFGNYNFVVPDVSDDQLTPEQYDSNTLLRNAFDRRLDLRAQESAIDASVQGIRLARSSMMPSLSLSGSIGSGFSSLQQRTVLDDQGLPMEGPDGFSIREDVPFGTQIDNNRSQTIGLNLQIPIFNRFFTRTQVQRAQVQYDNARLDLENLQQDIGLQVRQSYLDYLTDEKRLDVTEKQLRAAEQALEAEQERYNVGASTLVELTQARANFVQASSDRADAKYTFLFRKRLIEYYIGVLDPGRPLFE
jgi:outer membrane protein